VHLLGKVGQHFLRVVRHSVPHRQTKAKKKRKKNQKKPTVLRFGSDSRVAGSQLDGLNRGRANGHRTLRSQHHNVISGTSCAMVTRIGDDLGLSFPNGTRADVQGDRHLKNEEEKKKQKKAENNSPSLSP
jgi:hypothetical protein